MLHPNKPFGQILHYDRFTNREVTMLDLSCKQQGLSITTPMGDVIQISILDTTSDSAMLSIDTPAECIILREDTSKH